LAKNRYHQKSILSIFSNEESDNIVAICPIALIKYMIIVSVHGAIHHFLKVGRKAIKSIMSVRIIVLRTSFEMNQ